MCCDSQKTVHQNETNQTSLFLSSKFLFINLMFFIIKKIKNTSINLVLFLFIYFSIRGLKKKQKSKKLKNQEKLFLLHQKLQKIKIPSNDRTFKECSKINKR